jgi:hypothetical protein
MSTQFSKSQIALAVATALGATAMGTVATTASAGKGQGKYVSGDFHNHTTCSDGSISMQKLVKKATDKIDTPWGLDWFVQAGHGGSGNRNCTLIEDATLATPAYPFLSGATPFDVPTGTNPSPSQYTGPSTFWSQSIGAANVKGNAANGGVALSTQANPAMWRWQSIQEFQYPVMEYLAAYRDLPLFIGLESVVAGHEHTSMSVITGQMPAALDTTPLPSGAPYTALGNATALAQWSYCFDRGDTDWSRGNKSIADATGNNWDCSVTGSPNAADPNWNATAQKLVPTGSNVGEKGHNKTVEAMKWMKEFHPNGSYYVPAHLERAGPFNPNGNNGFNVEHLRNFNNAAPQVAFGMETQPGHHASDQRGEYTIRRNNFSGTFVDSVGGTTYGGTGVYGAQIGGVWDALLGEGRNFWFFASSDWHNRGSFGPDDRRSTQDFYPGEYQRNYTMVRDGRGSHRSDDKGKRSGRLTPQEIVDGLRTGNTFVASGQLIDRMAFVACASYGPDRPTPVRDFLGNAVVEALAVAAAVNNTDVDLKNCATMGEKLVVRPGADIVVSIVVRDPSGTNYSPYTFDNPSLAPVGISQPLNAPVLDHVDVIRGMVTGYKTPGAPDYAGEWPRDWIQPYLSGGSPNLATVPDAAKNTSAAILKTFNSATWRTVSADRQLKAMTFRIREVNASQYIRLRGTNLPPSVPYETDADGNPLPDVWTNSSAINPSVSGGTDGIPANANLKIVCSPVGTNVPDNGITYTGNAIDGCPNHLPVVNGFKYVAYDVAAWADLWFYGNPIFIEVEGSTKVAGVK